MQDDGVYLGLGSNRGNRVAHLLAGLVELEKAGIRIEGVSSLYLSEPVLPGGRERTRHPWYVNCVAALGGTPEARALLRLCAEVEERCGRRRGPGRWEPRTLDLDLLLYGRQVVEAPDLVLPHPRMHGRRFVLLPLSELAPDAWHPVEGATVAQLLQALPTTDRVWLLAPAPRPGGGR